jgi:hypothetical protein
LLVGTKVDYIYVDEYGFNNRANWELKFSLWPRKCKFTGRTLWLRYAYRGRAIWTGPGENVVEDKWCDRKEFLILRLKGIV